MERFFSWQIRHRKSVIVLFIVIISICAFCQAKVKVNTNLADYLPKDSASTIALDEMGREFTGDIPNAEMMVSDISMLEAARLQDKIEALDGVKDVSGIRNANLLGVPYEFLGEDAVRSYYKDGNALYTLTLDPESGFSLLEDLKNVTDKRVSLAGSFVTSKHAQKNSGPEVIKTVAIVIVFAIVLFMFTMDSWLTPFLLVGTLLCAVIINSGTNLIFGTISSVTNTAASVLQMGVSVDYFIFILHRYREYTDMGRSSDDAMILALTNSGSSVVSSSLTTVIGFAALAFMRYGIGIDMGIVLSKGVLISLICAFTLLPCLILSLDKWMNRTRHKPLIFTAYKLSAVSMKIRYPVMVLFLILLIPALVLQSKSRYYYGSSHFYSDDHPVMVEKAEIESVFGQKNTIVILVPKGDTASEYRLTEALREMPETVSVTSYTGTFSPHIPYEMIPEKFSEQLISESYSRFVLTLNVDEESESTFALIDRIREKAQSLYAQPIYIAGNSASTLDLKSVISKDNTNVNLIAVCAIFMILVLTMRSLRLPLLLTFCIKGAIWISMAVSCLKGDRLFYIGYLIVSSILLGSTVDYAILATNRFLEFKETMHAKNAIRESIAHSAVSVLTSGLILMAAGGLLGVVCTDQLTAQLGTLLARGTFTAMFVVLFALPGLLQLIFPEKKEPKEKEI